MFRASYWGTGQEGGYDAEKCLGGGALTLDQVMLFIHTYGSILLVEDLHASFFFP
jgi:hypothetical protein